MTEQVGNPTTGIGLHEATLAIDQLLGPEEDTQEQAEAQEPEEAQDYEEETEAEEYSEEDEDEQSDPDEEDDTEEVIRHRMSVYEEQTAPLIDTYSARGIVVTVDGLGAVEEVTGRIVDALAAAGVQA